MARLNYPDPQSLSQKTQDLLSQTADINIFKMLAHCETLITPFLTLGGAILMRSKIDPVLREIAIVRAAVHCNSAYELRQHDAIALEVGVTQTQLDDLREDFPGKVFNNDEQAIIRFTDELVRDVKVSATTFASVKAFLQANEIQELIIAVGYYSMVGRFLETLEVDLEVGDEIAVVKISEIRKN